MSDSPPTAERSSSTLPMPAPVPRETRRARICAVLTDSRPPARHDIPDEVTDLEVRADLAGDLDPKPLRRRSRQLVYVLRSTANGGLGPDTPHLRRERLLAAARRYDIVDLEADRDLVPDLLDAIPPPRRRISWHGVARTLAQLQSQFARMSRVPAQLYLLTTSATSAEQALLPLCLLAALRRADVTAFGAGPAGIWSRLLAPWLGAPIVFGSLTDTDDSAAPAVRQLLADYPFPDLPPLDSIFGIAGGAASRSASPGLHNAAYRVLGRAALFLPFPVFDLHSFWYTVVRSGLDSVGVPLRGLTVSAPLKEAALTLADLHTPAAYAAGAANLVVRRDGGWLADTTDGVAAVAALRSRGVSLRGSAAAVIGCGGAGRAVAAELIRTGAMVTLVNRGTERGRLAADLLSAPLVSLSSFRASGYSVLVNATPIRDELPFAGWEPAGDEVVVDYVYHDRPTAIVKAALEHGLSTVTGWEVLEREVACQFRLMTGDEIPHARPPPGAQSPANRKDLR